MIRSTLNGQHTYESHDGTKAHIYLRDDVVLARGHYQGRPFTETLGKEKDANKKLYQLLGDFEENRYCPPCERTQPNFATRYSVRLTVIQLANLYLKAVRKRRGKKTHDTYQGRLKWLMQFFELSLSTHRWAYVTDIDKDTAFTFREWLAGQLVTPNGRDGAKSRRISPGYQRNVLEAARDLFSWALDIKMNDGTVRMPVTWLNPFNRDVVGRLPARDPLKNQPFTIAERITLVNTMDLYQVRLFALPLVLPNRLGEWASLMIESIDPVHRIIRVGHVSEDPTKSRTAFSVAYPPEFVSIVEALIAGRTAGPIFVRRDLCELEVLPTTTLDEVRAHLATLPAESITQENDRKDVYRAFLVSQGAVNEDKIAREFECASQDAGLISHGTFHDLRSSVDIDLKRAGVEPQVRKYLNGRKSSDIQFKLYEGVQLHEDLAPYFKLVKALISAVVLRHRQLALGSLEGPMIEVNQHGARMVHAGCTPYEVKD